MASDWPVISAPTFWEAAASMAACRTAARSVLPPLDWLPPLKPSGLACMPQDDPNLPSAGLRSGMGDGMEAEEGLVVVAAACEPDAGRLSGAGTNLQAQVGMVEVRATHRPRCLQRGMC